jgi:Ca2+-binding RTX toxin-like protein
VLSVRARAALLAAATLTGLLAAPTSAAVVAETCQGLPATIVASSKAPATGTQGDDVIVGHDYVSIDARGGNDVICLDSGYVAAGDGNDSVLVTGTTGTSPEDSHVDALLGAGDDRYVGGPGEDWVNEFEVGGGSDIISTGGGPDAVNTPKDATSPYHLVLDLGAGGGDVVNLTVLPPGSLVQAQAGDGFDTLIFEGDSGDHFFDLGTGVVTMSGVQTASLAGFEEHYLYTAPGTGLRVLGTPGPDRVRVSGGRLDLLLGGGRDSVVLEGYLWPWKPSGAIDLGEGKDELWAEATKFVAADLVRRHIVIKSSGRHQGRMSLVGLERFRGSAQQVVVRGGPGAERLYVAGCQIRLSGGAGSDRLAATSYDSPGCGADVVGGGGPDRLIGGSADDRLIGGPGNDLAHGRAGTDTCRAEREKFCEL